MAVSFTNLLNDDGSNTVGTLIDKAQFQALLMGAQVLSTSTGAQNNWTPGVDGHTFIEWNGAADAAITGLAGGQAGLSVCIRNVGVKVATFAYNSASSLLAARFVNTTSSGPTPIAAGGFICYRHDGTQWFEEAHEQGFWITPAYVAGDFTPSVGTWTVDAGDITTYAYRLSGHTLTVSWYLQTTTVSGTPTNLRIKIPNGFTAAKNSLHTVVHDDAGAGNAGSFCLVSASGTTIDTYKTYGTGSFANATNTTRLFGTITFEVN
jgi:hypothetical protein